jgi:hypothetical protein
MDLPSPPSRDPAPIQLSGGNAQQEIAQAGVGNEADDSLRRLECCVEWVRRESLDAAQRDDNRPQQAVLPKLPRAHRLLTLEITQGHPHQPLKFLPLAPPNPPERLVQPHSRAEYPFRLSVSASICVLCAIVMAGGLAYFIPAGGPLFGLNLTNAAAIEPQCWQPANIDARHSRLHRAAGRA